MARYKHIDTGPRFIAVDLERQLLPGSFEHALNHLIDHELDLSGFDARYRNDSTGAPAFPPGLLLKVVLFAYSQGIVSSRGIERACRENITFIALCGDTAPSFTTLAAFVSRLGDDIAPLFAQVLWLCDRQGLIGREMFAIDGVKLPSNASKKRSGTRADFERQAAKLEAAAQDMLTRHRANDDHPIEPDLATKARQRAERLSQDAADMRRWLTRHPEDRKGAKGTIRQSNRTDNDSAKMATDKGVIQGYCGVAAVDERHQIIVVAQAHGTGSEQALLLPVIAATAGFRDGRTLITADAGYHSDANMAALADANIPALVADNGMRQRDARFTGRERYKAKPDPIYAKAHPKRGPRHYRPQDFAYDAAAGTCHCPAGKRLYQNGANCIHNGRIGTKFQGALRDCGPCTHRRQCLRTPEKTPTRQVVFFRGKVDGEDSPTERMKRAIDSAEGKALYGKRLGTVEPVFANIRHNKKLNRFTLRGQRKVDGQWKLYCLVHNIEKLARYGNLEMNGRT